MTGQHAVQKFGGAEFAAIGRIWKNPETVAITASESTSPSVDARTFAGGSVQIPVGSSITTLTFYADHDRAGVFGTLYDADGTAISLTVAAGRTYELPATIFNVPYFKMVGNTTGNVSVFLKG